MKRPTGSQNPKGSTGNHNPKGPTGSHNPKGLTESQNLEGSAGVHKPVGGNVQNFAFASFERFTRSSKLVYSYRSVFCLIYRRRCFNIL